ncbi:MAG: hypothetical protein C1942_02100 [Prosthecochloris sp.]|uniref:HU family DNA-binding protein n=1 Tax=Prosthecochloris sp. TaxID=290513 RepID=UPI0013C866AB|nr:HU family DNA-binding protein [Prosthecochloris sp.]NEX11481.1 hypothetical protein [Prosthecochloris sp.]
MKNDLCISRLAETLGLDHATVRRYLELFVSGLGEELLERRSICLKGLGLFEVRHLSGGYRNGQWFPPVRSIVFSSRSIAGSSARALIERKTGLSPREAALFIKVLSGFLRDALRARQDLVVDGIGAFRTVDGKYCFTADRTMKELVNQAYGHLPVLDLRS